MLTHAMLLRSPCDDSVNVTSRSLFNRHHSRIGSRLQCPIDSAELSLSINHLCRALGLWPMSTLGLVPGRPRSAVCVGR